MPLKFKCPFNEECRNCCVFNEKEEMPIVFEDEKEMLENLGQREFEEIRFGNVKLYRWIIKGRCPFNDPNTGLCKIHEKKPLSCKMFPLNLRIKGNEVSIELSFACSWVKAHPQALRLDPKRVFPREWKALEEALERLRRALT